MSKTASTSFALSVAAVLAAGCGKQAAPEAESVDSAMKVKCMGVNECEGQADCGGQGHPCAGQDECRGKGWISTTKAKCEQRGGKIL